MFEKEAKERARDFTNNKERQVAYECGFLDGADRMKEEMQKQGLALQSDMNKTIEQNCVLKKRIEKMKNLEEDNADLKQSLDGANEREKENTERITTLEEEKCELLGIIQDKDKAIKELEEKFSVLLSCKNCPENKGGYICQKEYEDKCLAQKIQYIKELQEENEELKEDNKVMSNNYSKMEQKFYDNLSKAKAIIKDLMNNSDEYAKQRASDFLKEE